MATLLVDNSTLLVHHVVIFQQALTNTEVVLFYLALCTFDAIINHLGLNHLAVLEAQLIHYASNALRSEQTHQVVFQRNEEYRRTRVTLTTCTTTQLTVDTTALVTFCTDNSQTTCGLHFIGELNIRTTTSHVRCNGYSTEHALFFVLIAVSVFNHYLAQVTLTSLGYDISLLLVQLSIQYLVRNATELEHTAQEFAHIDVGRTYQYGATCETHLLNLFDDSLILFALGLIDAVVHIDTCNGAVGRNFYNIEFVDVPELTSLCNSRTRHTSQLMIHTEVVLQRNRSESLRCSLYLYVFLGLNSLVQAITPTTAFHDTTCLFVDYLYLTVHYHILFIDAEHGISLQQLEDRMYTVALDRVVL